MAFINQLSITKNENFLLNKLILKNSNKSNLFKVIYLFTLFFLIFENIKAQSPNWIWANATGGPINDYNHSITTDALGNVYTTGLFFGTVDFDPGPGIFNLTSSGAGDLFISKLSASGNLIWAKAVGGNGFVEGYSIAVDAVGNVYTTGWFSGQADFDPGPGTFNLITNGNQDIFICKLNASGNFAWAKSMGNGAVNIGKSVAIDFFGNVYTTGSFEGNVDFDPGPGTFFLYSPSDNIFISKLDSSGNFVWAKRMGGLNASTSNSIAIDSFNNVYTTGVFEDSVDFDPGPGVFNLTSTGYQDIFISKLDNLGNFKWAKAIGGYNGHDWAFCVAVDISGNVYTTGYFDNTADFDPGPGIYNLISAGVEDIYISKLDSAGNFVFAKAFGGRGSDRALSIATDPSKYIYTTGAFRDTVDFDPGPGIYNLVSNGTEDVFITKLDPSGNFIWAKQAGGTTQDFGTSIAISSSGNVYLGGNFNSPSISFGSITLQNTENSGNTQDMFLARLDVITGIGSIVNNSIVILISPNPATDRLTISLSGNNKKVKVTLTDITGKIVKTINSNATNRLEINTENFASGVYLALIQAGNLIETKKFVIVK